MTEDIEYFENKKADKTYISKRIVNTDMEGNLTRPVRIARHVFDPAETYSQARVAEQVVLRATALGREEVKATFYEDDRSLLTLVIQRFTRASGAPHRDSFSFSGVEILTLLQFLDNIRKYHFPSESSVNITDQELRRIVTSGQLNSLLQDNQHAFHRICAVRRHQVGRGRPGLQEGPD
jgi:hypothetical protein